MAQIAEDLLLLLLDNAANRPALDRDRREKVLGGAVLLDLALACRVRPSVDGEPAGRLLLLTGPDLDDPILDPALRRLQRRPLKPHTALAKLGRGVEPALLHHLEQGGHIRPIQLRGNRFNGTRAWPMANRSRVDKARSALIAALFDNRCPSPTTAAIISLLYPVDGLGALLSLNERGWDWVQSRAADIAGGCWVDESAVGLPQVNLAVTASAVKPALT
jgi:hypothetical protein